MTTIHGITRVLDNAAVPYTLTDGWEDRVWVRDGRPFTWEEIRAVVVHTTETADAAFQRDHDAPTLGWVTSGQGYHTYGLLIGRGGKVYVISAHPGAQAGYGVWPHTGDVGSVIPRDMGNAYSLGVSMDANGSGYPPTTAQLDALARVLAALQDDWDGELEIIGHGEYNGGVLRTDPCGVPGGMDAIRAAARRRTWAVPTEHAATITATEAHTHTIAPGDTYWALSRRYGVPVAVLRDLNPGVDENSLRIGARIHVGQAARVHVVDKGETLTGIARRYDTTVDTLVKLNGLKDPNVIVVGQILKVGA